MAWIISIVLVLSGAVGVFVPLVPGTVLVWLGLLVAAAVDSFERVGWGTMIVLGFLVLLSYGVDAGASVLGVRRTGASRSAIIGTVAGAIVGLFFGIAGVLFGPFVGAAAGELLARRDLNQAGRVGFGAWIGTLLGTALKFVIVCVMIGVFVLSYLV